MLPTLEQLRLISGAGTTPAVTANIASIIVGLDKFGADVGLDLPHRLAHYLAQLAHESGNFRYDKEIWGNTPAQQKYDTRTDLGNTPEKDGDGKLYMGRTGIQLTGKANYKAATDWAKKQGYNPPDFVKQPELVNTDPWEGLIPIWFWTEGNQTHKSLNIYADSNDLEMITRKINGGTNGLEDRMVKYTRAGLVLLGYDITDMDTAIRKFQSSQSVEVDGIDGPQTRSKIHVALTMKAKSVIAADPAIEVKKAPVTETKEVAVVPKNADKPGKEIIAVGTAVVAGAASKVDPNAALGTFQVLTPWIQGALILIVVGALVYWFFLRQKLAARATEVKEQVERKAQDGLPS